MTIKVWKAYSGNRAKKPIKVGMYKDDDPRIYGLASYLIDNGNAVEVGEAQEPDEPKPRKTRSDKGKVRTRKAKS
jgi:hypothetical protein